MSASPPRWHYAYSGTLRSIYVMRYLLFSGGVAVLFGVLERQLTGWDRSGLGLLVGLALGLVLFRGQLRPLRAPQLALSQDAVYLVERKQAVTLPWHTVRAISVSGHRVILELTQPLRAPTGELADQIQLEPRTFGSAPAALKDALTRALNDEAQRRLLPSDQRVRSLLSIQGTS
jgi:hypothetical protein